MSTLDIINSQKKKVGDITLADSLMSEKINKAVLHQAVKRILAGRHHGTVDTKTRAEVDRTSKKIYRQKGTGNARHGSRKSMPFVGGGRVFGPHPRDFTLGMNKKVRKLALREALRSQLIESKVTVVDSIPLKQIKTKEAKNFLKGLGIESGLVILESPSKVVEKSIRNLLGFKVTRSDQINVFDILKYPHLLFTSKAFGQVQERYLA